MSHEKRSIIKFVMPIVFFILTSCTTSFFHGGIKSSKEGPKGVFMTTEDLTDYLVYNTAIYGGYIDKAQEVLEKLIEKYPERLEFYSDLIGIYVYRKDMKKSLELIDRALKVNPNNVNILISLSDVYAMKGDRKSAIATLEKVLSIDENRENVPIVLANLYYQEKEFEKAVQVLEKYLKARPNDFLGNVYLGKIYEELGKHAEAAKAYENALKEREEDEIMIALDNLYDKLGDKQKSIEILERFLSRNADYPKVRERLALLYLSINNYEKALENYEMLLKRFPDNKDLALKYSIIAIDGGFFDKAKAKLLDIINIDPNNQKALYYMGILFKEKREWQRAIEYFERVKDKEYEKSAKLYLAICFERLGQGEKALNILLEYWEKEHDSDAGYYLALYYKKNLNYARAKAILNELLNISEEKAKYILVLAEIYLKEGHFDDGIKLVKELLEKDRDNPDALNFIGYSYVERNMNLEEAETMLKRAIELKPKDPYIMDSLAWLYYMKKEYQRAYEIQKEVLNKVNDDATILEHMGDILMALGNKKEAKEYYLKALENEPENVDELKKKIDDLKDL